MTVLMKLIMDMRSQSMERVFDAATIIRMLTHYLPTEEQQIRDAYREGRVSKLVPNNIDGENQYITELKKHKNPYMKKFKLEVVLSAIQGILLCKIGEVYEILNYLTGDNLFTHQLPIAGRICRISVLKQHPFIKEIDVSDINPENWKEKLAAIKAKYPKSIELAPVDNWIHIDPIDEAAIMKNGDADDKSGAITVEI